MSPQNSFAGAKASFRAERYAEALAKTSQALRDTKPASPVYWQLRILNAEILLGKREASQAMNALAFQLPAAFSTPENRARQLYCKGFAASLLGNYSDAWTQLEQAAALARDSGNQELLAEVRNRQGVVALRLGHFEEGDELIRQSLAYAKEHSVKWLETASTGNLGNRFMRENRCEDAIPFFEQAAAAAQSAGATETHARNTGNLGYCYYRIGDLDRATEALQEAQEAFEKTGNRAEQMTWLGLIGNIYLARNEYPKAAAQYKRALGAARALGAQGESNAASWLTNLSRVLIETGELDEAEQYNNEALALKRQRHDKAAEVFSELNSARIAAARHHYADAEDIVRAILRSPDADPTQRLRAQEQLAIVLDATHRYGAAEAQYRSTLRELENGRQQLRNDDSRLAYLSTLIGFYQDFIYFLMERGKTEEALAVADFSHARTMRERLSLAETRTQRTDFRKLAAASKSTLLVYSLGSIKSYLWVITPAGVKATELPPEAVLRPLLEAYDQSIQALEDPLANGSAAARKLYDLLLAPAVTSVARTGRAIVVPDGLLYSLNFETLPIPGEKPHYWIDDATVSIAPSLGLLRPAEKEGAPGSLLLIGNPVSPDKAFPDLAYASQEMASIGKSFASARQVVLTKGEARPDKWQQARPADFDLIHFTAHATASREEPLASAVILSRAPDGAFRLHAREVMKTPIRARLVTISACRGAGTRIYSGEGLVGLAWAFLESGARSVIAGLWDVGDDSGAKEMAVLYRSLAAGHSPADSLREAKLDLIHSGGIYRKPWYWAEFQTFTTRFTP